MHILNLIKKVVSGVEKIKLGFTMLGRTKEDMTKLKEAVSSIDQLWRSQESQVVVLDITNVNGKKVEISMGASPSQPMVGLCCTRDQQHLTLHPSPLPLHSTCSL